MSPQVVPTPVEVPSRRTSEPSDDSLDDASDNDALITQALNQDGTPRRPMNAFMIFARRRRPEITANNPPLRTGEISKVLSSEWAAMSPADKQFYLDRARKLKDNFNARWPDYVYRRRPNNSRKRKRPDVGPPVHPLARSDHRHDPIVPSSKVKYEDGSQHPMLPSIPSTNAPLTMMYLAGADHRVGGLLGYGDLLPAPYPRGAATPSLSSSILTSASTSPRSVSSTLHSSYRYDGPMLSNSPSHRRQGAWKDAVLSPESSAGAFGSPYVPSLGYLPNKSSGSFDDYSREQDARHGDWTSTPPHAVRNTLALPAFASTPSFASFATDEPASAGSEFQPFPSEPHLEYQPDTGLVPVHPHFQRS